MAETAFHLLAKPSGPACNLACDYCFYLEKEALFDRPGRRRMAAAVLEAYVGNLIAATPADQPVIFAWQGGEPTLLGLPFFAEAVRLQRTLGAGRTIENSFQTNGILIDEDWAAFLAEHRFLVGLSLDGPAQIHDRHRRFRSGAPSHRQVMAALERLQRHGVDYNVMSCVNRDSARHPQQVYRFLKESGVGFIQFIPVVERAAGTDYAAAGFSLEGPGASGDASGMAPFAVTPQDWGSFLAGVFSEWRRKDVGRVFVMNFEWALAAELGMQGGPCVHQRECGRSLAMEHDGTVYACDHYVYPDYRLGNVAGESLADMVDSPRQRAFGQAKWQGLPAQCRACPHLGHCWGGCPKHRFLTTRDGEAGLNYLCAGYQHYYGQVRPWLATMARLLREGRSVEQIMTMRAPDAPAVAG
jgi:uncharacterized protein